MHDAVVAREPVADTLLDVAGAQVAMMRLGEVEVCQRICLGLL